MLSFCGGQLISAVLSCFRSDFTITMSKRVGWVEQVKINFIEFDERPGRWIGMPLDKLDNRESKLRNAPRRGGVINKVKCRCADCLRATGGARVFDNFDEGLRHRLAVADLDAGVAKKTKRSRKELEDYIADLQTRIANLSVGDDILDEIIDVRSKFSNVHRRQMYRKSYTGRTIICHDERHHHSRYSHLECRSCGARVCDSTRCYSVHVDECNPAAVGKSEMCRR